VSNPWLIFIAARIGLFVGFFTLLLLLGFEGIYSAVIAGVLALAVSLVFLSKQRDALSVQIYKRFHRDEFSGVPDEDADIENALLDLEKDDK
jgi:predicted Co/Zn/Cd cation transporter (cation efflux family)